MSFAARTFARRAVAPVRVFTRGYAEAAAATEKVKLSFTLPRAVCRSVLEGILKKHFGDWTQEIEANQALYEKSEA